MKFLTHLNISFFQLSLQSLQFFSEIQLSNIQIKHSYLSLEIFRLKVLNGSLNFDVTNIILKAYYSVMIRLTVHLVWHTWGTRNP